MEFPALAEGVEAVRRLELAEALADRDRVDRRGGHVARHARRAQIGTELFVVRMPERKVEVRAETGQGFLTPATNMFTSITAGELHLRMLNQIENQAIDEGYRNSYNAGNSNEMPWAGLRPSA